MRCQSSLSENSAQISIWDSNTCCQYIGESVISSKCCTWSNTRPDIAKTNQVVQNILLFCSLAVFDPRVGHTTLWAHIFHLFLSSVILIDSSTGSPVHVLMLSIQAVCGLPRLHAPGIVPCIISFSRQLPCFLMVWPYYASFLALTVSNSSLSTQLC